MLDKRLFGNRDGISFEEWKERARPFHWLSEYYAVLAGGGFDVIIGNPPYVEFKSSDELYGMSIYKTLRAYNLHALCVERSSQLLQPNGRTGMILPIGAFSTQNMIPLMNFIDARYNSLWFSFYHFRPSPLFNGANIATTIFIASNGEKCHHSVGVKKFSDKTRDYLFDNIAYIKNATAFRSAFNFCFPKISSEIENSILNKVLKKQKLELLRVTSQTSQSISYRTAGGLYWKVVINFDWPYVSTSNKKSFLKNDVDARIVTALLNSSLQWLLCTVSFDTLNFKDYYIFSIPFSYYELDDDLKNKIIELCEKLMLDYKKNAKHKMRGKTPCYEITAHLSKSIIDEIDTALAEHYGFTAEELDFIINYDIKYRMGSELHGGE